MRRIVQNLNTLVRASAGLYRELTLSALQLVPGLR